MVSSRLPTAASRAGGVSGSSAQARGLEQIRRLGGGVLQRDQACALRIGRAHRLVDLGGRPFHHAGLCGTAALGERAGGVVRGLALPLIVAERGQPRFLLVAQETVEFLQRRLHGLHRRDHRLDALLHGREPVRGGERDIGRAGGLDVLCRLDRGVGEIVERGALFVGRLDGLLELIDWQAGDVAAVRAAHLRQLIGRRGRRAGAARCPASLGLLLAYCGR